MTGGVSGMEERNAPSRDLKWDRVGASLTYRGKVFHSWGPLTAKEPSNMVRLDRWASYEYLGTIALGPERGLSAKPMLVVFGDSPLYGAPKTCCDAHPAAWKLMCDAHLFLKFQSSRWKSWKIFVGKSSQTFFVWPMACLWSKISVFEPTQLDESEVKPLFCQIWLFFAITLSCLIPHPPNRTRWIV